MRPARKLMEDAECHAEALREAAWDSPTTAAKTAASRAETQRARLEKYLYAAGLVSYDNAVPVYADRA